MLKSITTEQLRLGMYVHSIPGSWINHPFWRNSFLLEKPEDLQALFAAKISELLIDTSKGLDVLSEEELAEAEQVEEAQDEGDPQLIAAAAAITAAPARVTRVSTDVERLRAQKIISSSRDTVMSMFAEARMGKAIDIKDAIGLVTEITSSVSRNADALISLARLKNADDYTYMHSVAVCALMISLSNQLGLSADATRQAGMAGLLHDVGKMAVPLDILNKPAKLTEEEFASVRSHTVAGHAMLRGIDGIGSDALDVALHHHEKIDGSGYPFNLKGDQISLVAKMGAVCDVYDAVTSNRPYKAGWDPARSIKHMAGNQGHFDPMVLEAFVKAIGIYPTGSCVLMHSGKLALVVDQRMNNLLTPKVKVFYSTQNHAYLKPEIIDLGHASDKIIAYADPGKWGNLQLPNADL
ncbi:HD-GYP domain-containing protein [Herbaspirillum lusitanum]|jgi:putative nucleotidyltransferase with HDIG domain|uniref:HD-GYP domain-containing protein n=1 Tax=Herbaspirillum lusitanum TaxID=213312 RepID=A0ABW9ADS7_9BURK